MNVNFLNPFVEATRDVLRAEVEVGVSQGRLSLEKSALTTNDVTVLISLIGKLRGMVLYGMSTATGLALVSRVLDHDFTEIDELARSGIAELANVFAGQASIKLSKAGYESKISVPILIQGNGTKISALDCPRIVVPLETEIGSILVHLAIRENA